tara:strand:- start:84 stop:392 length:309 start_codon:yes stop_codon:yes gene_type:complete
MYNTNVKTNENMIVHETYDLEGNSCDWGYFVDPSDPKRRNIYKQPKPKTTPYLNPIEEEYEFEEGDYQVDIVPRISGYSILLTTVYILQYVICKLPGKLWSS